MYEPMIFWGTLGVAGICLGMAISMNVVENQAVRWLFRVLCLICVGLAVAIQFTR